MYWVAEERFKHLDGALLGELGQALGQALGLERAL
jgi:hypothetical protein